MCQNSVYISNEWQYLSNQKQFRIERLNQKRARVLSKCFWNIEADKQITIVDYGRPQSLIEEYRNIEKESYIIYPDSQEYLYIAQRDLRCEKVDQQMNVDTRKGYGT